MTDKTQTNFQETMISFSKLGYDLSFKDYVDCYGHGHIAVATNKVTKKKRTMKDIYYGRNCASIAAKLLTKLLDEALNAE